MKRRAFELHFFHTDSGYDLVETSFTSSDGQQHRCIRGKSAGAIRGSGSFQWSAGVRATTVLSLRHLLFQKAPGMEECIVGTRHSLAASLDYAITKRPLWLSDMFGILQDGELFARKLFLITNPNRKRPGPVVIRLNHFALAPSDIRVFVDREPVTDVASLVELLEAIERSEAKAAQEAQRNELSQTTLIA